MTRHISRFNRGFRLQNAERGYRDSQNGRLCVLSELKIGFRAMKT